MSNEISIANPQLYSGFNHVGSCRFFVWVPSTKPEERHFFIKELVCSNSFDTLLLQKDLYLCAESGEEYLVKEFQITDVSDPNNIRGVASLFSPLTAKFPEVKSSFVVENGLVAQSTQLLAIRAVSSMIGSIQSEMQINTREMRDAVGELVADISQAPDAVINLLAVKSYDDYTYAHNINVATLSLVMGHTMGLSRDELHWLGIGALLHDIGKLKIALSILNKEGALTEVELETIRTHPQIGYDMVANSKDVDQRALMIILQHHEKFGGKGYPNNLSKNDISLFARIAAIADVYDALTTPRPFRPAISPYLSMKILLSNSENHFDPAVLAVFLKRMSIYPPGSSIILNTGAIAAIIRPNPGAMLRPVIRLLKGPDGKSLSSDEDIDLLLHQNLYITGPVIS
ncbi:MAG: HD-GYP domain-containing protein [Candidatus Ozemobacteraceae bacterium]